jgi:hypothetical protein
MNSNCNGLSKYTQFKLPKGKTAVSKPNPLLKNPVVWRAQMSQNCEVMEAKKRDTQSWLFKSRKDIFRCMQGF